MESITRSDIEYAVERYLIKGGKIKKLKPERNKNLFWGMGVIPFVGQDEETVLEKVLDAIEVDFFETEERNDILLAEYYNENN